MSELTPGGAPPPTASPAAAAPPATPPASAAPATPPAATPPATPSWSDNLSPEMKNFVAARGFDSPAKVLDSYVGLEKLRGVPKERLLTLPEAADAPEWKEVYKRLGTPDTKEGYELKPTTGDDPEFFNWATDTFHGLNLTKDQAKGVMEKFNNYVSERNTSAAESQKVEIAQQEAKLKKEWGAAYAQNSVTADVAIKKLGIPDNAVKALGKELGFDGAMKLLSQIGSNLGEASFHGGGGSGFGQQILTPSQANAKIAALKQDKDFSAKYLNGDATARKTMTDLHAMANPNEG